MKADKKLSLKGKTILVTGGAGFVGSHLVDLLISENPKQIIVIDREIKLKGKEKNLKNAIENFPNIKIIQQDLASYSALHKIFKKNNVSIVFHLATLSLYESLKRPRRVVMANLKSITNLVELQRLKMFETLIAISSSEAYGSALDIPMRENHPLNPHTPYAAAKASADLITLSYCRTFKNDISIVRPFNQYGPRHNPNHRGVVTSTILALLDNQRPVVFGDGEQTRDYIFVKDTARGIVDAYKNVSTRGQIVNLGTGKMIKIKDLVNTLIKISGKDLEIEYLGPRVADVKSHCADIKQAKELMGWRPNVNLEDGLLETYNWFKDEAS